MVSVSKESIIVPLDVPKVIRETYVKNYLGIKKGVGRLMLFAGDQKVEHLNDDSFGEGVVENDADPERLLRIRCKAKVGVFGTQFGLITPCDMSYKDALSLNKQRKQTLH